MTMSDESETKTSSPSANKILDKDPEAQQTDRTMAALTDHTQELQEAMDATWGEVLTACCVHSPTEWGYTFLGIVLIAFFLYFFMLALEILGSAAKVMTGCAAGGLFGSDANPVAGVMIGMLATVLLQSSSTTTSIIVSMVGSAITVDQGIYMVMGANIGTSVTNTIVAMGQMGDGRDLERAFAGATVHDLFNFLTVGILLPLEALTGYLAVLTGAMVKNAEPRDGDTNDSFIKKMVGPIADRVIKSNKNIIKDVANGASCSSYYPIDCIDGVESYENCDVALIACSKDYGCPAFFDQNNTQSDETIAGAVCFVLSILLLFVCLVGLVAVLKKMLFGVSARIIYKATDLNGYFSMVIGAGLTMAVQSSSITTSVLTPLVGIGVLPLESMLPLTLGANIGTTITGLMASMVSDSVDSLQVALAHLMFNITGIIIWYPIPFMRSFPLSGARILGKLTRVWKGFPVVYLAVVFFLIPLYLLAISTLFTEDQLALTVVGTVLVILTAGALAYTFFWCRYKGGSAAMIESFRQSQRKQEAFASLPDDMEELRAKTTEIEMLKQKIEILMAHTGAPEVEEEDPEIQKLMSEESHTGASTSSAEALDESLASKRTATAPADSV